MKALVEFKVDEESGVWTISRMVLKAWLAFAGYDETRHVTAGVLFAPADGRVVATNGHTMAVMQVANVHVVAEMVAAPFVINAKALLDALSGSGRNIIQIIPGPKGVQLYAASKVDSTYSLIGEIAYWDHKFPTWDQVVPAYRDGEGAEPSSFVQVGINMAFVAQIATLQKALDAEGTELQFATCENVSREPIRFTIVCPLVAAEAYVIVMPVDTRK